MNILINPLEDLILLNNNIIDLDTLFKNTQDIDNIYVINGPGAYTAVKRYLSIVKAFSYKGFNCFSLNILDILKYESNNFDVAFFYKNLIWYSNDKITEIVNNISKVNTIGILNTNNNIQEYINLYKPKIVYCDTKNLNKYLFLSKNLEQKYYDKFN